MAKIYGYARVSTKGQANDGNSLEHQEKLLRENGATEIFKDTYTGTKLQRPEFDKLLNLLENGDTLIVTKLDRFARSMIQGSELVNELINRGVKVNILNIGVMDNTASSKLVRNIFFSFAEFERDMIVERTQEGKEMAKQRCKESGKKFIEGRPTKFTKEQLDIAMQMLETKTYKEVEKILRISRATLVREKAKRKAEEIKN